MQHGVGLLLPGLPLPVGVRRRAAAAAAPFVPTDLGSSVLKAWYDFSDTGTITESGGAVSQVTDKSGNGNTVIQTVAGSKPTTGSNTLNGLNVLTFDGGDELHNITSVSLPNNDFATMVAIVKFDSGTSGGIAFFQNVVSSGDGFDLARNLGETGCWGNNTGSSAGLNASFADSDNTNWHNLSAPYTRTTRTIFQDGTSKATNALNTNACTTTGLYIGLATNIARSANIQLTGKIAELFILSGVDTTNRQKIEGYTSWKWGLQSQLDAGHPYKSAAP